MFKQIVIAATGILLTSTTSLADASTADSYEFCVPSDDGDLCALRVTDTDTQKPVWLVTEKSVDLKLIWGGNFWLISEEDYAEVKTMVPKQITLPAVDPTSGETLEYRKGKPATPAPAPKPSTGGTTTTNPGGGSLITVGNITIGGGSANCTDCHTGNMKDIHAKVLPENASK